MPGTFQSCMTTYSFDQAFVVEEQATVDIPPRFAYQSDTETVFVSRRCDPTVYI